MLWVFFVVWWDGFVEDIGMVEVVICVMIVCKWVVWGVLGGDG